MVLYSLDMPTLERLAPDLLVTQALCDVCTVAACRLPGHPQVLNLEPMSLEDVFTTLLMVGDATGTEAKAEAVMDGLRERVRAVEEATQLICRQDRLRVAFIEWIDPIFSGGHWNPTRVERAGGINVLGHAGQPSRTTPWQQVVESQPDVMFIACCGFAVECTLKVIPILRQQPGWCDLPCVREGQVYVTDGNAYFSRPGLRLVDGLELLAHVLFPSIFPQFLDVFPVHRVVGRV